MGTRSTDGSMAEHGRFRIQVPALWLVLFLAVVTGPLWLPQPSERPETATPAAVETAVPAADAATTT